MEMPPQFHQVRRTEEVGTVTKPSYKWVFRSRFRRHAFGWRSQPAITRIREAVSEIKKVARKDPVLGAEGAVLFLEKVAAAIQNVDGSSGAIGSSVNRAIVELSAIIGRAPADDIQREKWLNRLWQAIQDDDMPYLELLADEWGEVCATKVHASHWADEFIDTVRAVWSPDTPRGSWFKGSYACLSALFKAERYDELIELVELDSHNWWSSRFWCVKALAVQGKGAAAIEYAEATDLRYANPASVAQTCEEILLTDGLADEAYSRYALAANRKTTHLATFRAIAAKYPDRDKATILHDLVTRTRGEEGKWFAAAKSVGLFEEAIELANCTPCDPKTLTRAARDMAKKNPAFAMEAGLTALRWLLSGYGYDITSIDVSSAYLHTMAAAVNAGCAPAARARVTQLLENASSDGMFSAQIMQRMLLTEETNSLTLPADQ